MTPVAEAMRQFGCERVSMWEDASLSVTRGMDRHSRGEQPLVSEDGSTSVWLDGEVFDDDGMRRGLMKRGHIFRDDSTPAELCLHAYDEYGARFLPRLNGSFLLVIYRPKVPELLIANDRCWTRPLYLYEGNGDLAFSTQLSALIRHRAVRSDLDSDGLVEFLVFTRIMGGRTLYRGIRKLPSASAVTCRKGHIQIKRYWDPPATQTRWPSFSAAADELAARIRIAMRRLTSDGRDYGLMLSGGLDSRTMLACCDVPVHAFTFDCGRGYEQEVRLARHVAKATGQPWTMVRASPNYDAEFAPVAASLAEGMYLLGSGLWGGLLDIIRQEQPSLEVMLSGMFVGPRQKATVRYCDEHKGLRHMIARNEVPAYGLSDVTEILLKHVLSSQQRLVQVGQLLRGYDEAAVEEQGYVALAADFQSQDISLGNFWHGIDRYQMATPEVVVHPGFLRSIRRDFLDRYVAFDNDLVELGFRLPFEWRWDSRLWAAALRRINPRLACIPDQNTGAPPILPWRTNRLWGILWSLPQKLRRRLSPLPGWPTPAMASLMRSTFSDEDAIPADLFDRQALMTLLDNQLAGSEHNVDLLLAVFTFALWYRKWGGGASSFD